MPATTDKPRRLSHRAELRLALIVPPLLLLGIAGAIGAELSRNAHSPTTAVSVLSGRFSRTFLTVRPGETVRWTDNSPGVFTVATSPKLAPTSFALHLTPGTSSAYTFRKPGLYVLYAKQLASWATVWHGSPINAHAQLPRPSKASPLYPSPMVEFVAVKGYDPSAARSLTVGQPWDYYAPAFGTLTQGGWVTYYNVDNVPHTAATVPGLAPQGFSLWLGAYTHSQVQLTQPGLYVVYGPDVTKWDYKTNLPTPLRSTDVYPEAMFGVIWVTPGPTPLPRQAGLRPTRHPNSGA